MIDLHCHVLPGLDDGPPDLSASLALVRAAASDGVQTIVATPHVDSKHEYDIDQIAVRTGELNLAIARQALPVVILSGAEIAPTRLPELDDAALGRLGLGGTACLMIESPYTGPIPFLDGALSELQEKGFQPILAHPERCPTFQQDLDRLRNLVACGVLCSIDAGSLLGRFGSRPQTVALTLLEEGLAHNVASDAHDLDRRPPGVSAAFQAAAQELPGILEQVDWYTRDAPSALLAGEPLPRRPPSLRRRGRLRRLIRVSARREAG